MKIFFPISLITLFCCSNVFGQEDFFHPELEWRTIHTEHFYVHYHLGAERTAKIIAKIAEDIYEPITSFYNHKPDGKVSFIVKDYDDYSNGATYFFDNKIEIWASALDFDLRGTHNWLRNVVSHEFTHLIQIQATLKFGRKVPAIYFQWLQYEAERRTDVLYGYPNGIVSYPISGFVVPVWFAEGVAQYMRKEFGYESWDSHRDMILRMYALENKMLTWNEMSVFGKTSLGNESAYNSGYALVRYIADHYGENKLREISDNLRSFSAITIDGAIEKAIGKDGIELYNEWKDHLINDYNQRIEHVKDNVVAGRTIADVGYANFYSTFSPDGKRIAYVSNKESDYFSPSSIYLYDVETKTERLLKAGVRSNISWSPYCNKIFYSKLTRKNTHWSSYSDIFVYDFEHDIEKRLTYGLRADAPSISPDGKTIAFLSGKDGTMNLSTMNIDGTNVHKLTNYSHGEQIYNPKWSPDGEFIIFDYSIKDGRDIAVIPSSGGDVSFLLAADYDERNAIFTSNGNNIIYASDITGIFNLYEYNLTTKTTTQLTNVLGGAFMPTVNSNGQIAFSNYTSSGYKIAMFDSIQPQDKPGTYRKPDKYVFQPETKLTSINKDNSVRQFDWQKLSSYDDTKLPQFKETAYKNTTSGLALFPFVRVDNYNPKNKGIDIIKLGLYAYSYDVLDKYGFFAGVGINRKGERDLFVIFDYRGKIPGLYHLGAEPALSFELYNITRKANDATVTLGENMVSIGISYSLFEFDVVMKHKIFSDILDLELRYAHSRYTAIIGSFSLPERPDLGLIPASNDLYLIGNNISATFRFDGIKLSRTREINPLGRKVRLRYEYEFNKSNPTGEYENSDGIWSPKYQNIRFHRLEFNWREYVKLPAWKHTLSAQLRGGTIFGPPVDNFFNFYIGGLAGMKGYTFYSLGGNEFGMANLTYRFPIVEDIDQRFLHIIFNHLYGAVYGDIGTAWTGGGPEGKKYKRDAGVELRLEAFSYYAFPTRIFFNATYGFDRFDYFMDNTKTYVNYGKEWAFHFGVLFGFDFD